MGVIWNGVVPAASESFRRSGRLICRSWLDLKKVTVCNLWDVAKGSSLSWVAKLKGDKLQNASCQMGGREVTGR